MPAVSLSGVYSAQFLTDAGVLAANYRLYTYAPATTTKKVAYTETTGTTAHTYVSDGSGGEYIALNARGELPAPLFLAAGGYDICLKTSAGATVWTRRAYGSAEDADTDSAALAASGGSALVGFVQAGGGTATTVQAKLRERISVKDFGALGDGTGNDATAIAAAITYAAGLNSSLGAEVFFPAGVYNCTSGSIDIPANVILTGCGQRASTVYFRHTGNGFMSVSALNSSTTVRVAIRDLGIITDNVSNTGAGFVEVGGTLVDLSNIYFFGFKYGVIFNQTEIATIDRCNFDSQITAGIWLVNGGDDANYPTASVGYTNRITITRNQFNQGASAYCIVDDGGLNHTISDNNFNGGLRHIRAASNSSITIAGNEFEGAAGPCISFHQTTLAGSTSGINPGAGIEVSSNMFIPVASQNAIQFTSAASAVLLNNNFSSSLSAAASVLITSLTNLVAIGNRDEVAYSGAATYAFIRDSYTGVEAYSSYGYRFGNTGGATTGTSATTIMNDYDRGTFTPSLSATGSTFNYAASGQIGRYERRGKFVRVTIYIQLATSGNTLTSNALTITGLPFTSVNSVNVYGVAQATWAAITTSLVGMACQVAANSTAVVLFKLAAAAVGYSVMNADDLHATNGSTIQLSIEYEAA